MTAPIVTRHLRESIDPIELFFMAATFSNADAVTVALTGERVAGELWTRLADA